MDNTGFLLNGPASTFSNAGSLSNEAGAEINNGGSFVNSGSLDNQGSLENSAAFSNAGSFTIAAGAGFYNYNTLTNTGNLDNQGLFANSAGATVDNRSGTMVNHAWFYNSGTLLTGDGTFTGAGSLLDNDGAIVSTGATAVRFTGGVNTLELNAMVRSPAVWWLSARRTPWCWGARPTAASMCRRSGSNTRVLACSKRWAAAPGPCWGRPRP